MVVPGYSRIKHRRDSLFNFMEKDNEIKGGKKLKEEKTEQLKVVFKKILEVYLDILGSWNIDAIVNKLLYEVKIRNDNK